MLGRHARTEAIPNWVDSLHRAVLHGTPDDSVREDVLSSWNSHATELFEDQTISPITRLVKILGSSARHSIWRLTRGPATTVSTGILAALVGVAAAAFFVREPGQLITSKNGLAFLGLALLGFVFVKYPTDPPVKITVAAFFLLIPAAVWTAWEYMTAPEIGMERVAAVGAILCIAGALVFGRSAQTQSHELRATAWHFFAFGMASFALSNLVGATQYESAEVRVTAAIASWIEVLLVASMLRNARAELARSSDSEISPRRTPTSVSG